MKTSWWFRLVCKSIYIPYLTPTHTYTNEIMCAKMCFQNVSSNPWWNTSQCKMTLQINTSILSARLEMGPRMGQILYIGLCTGFQHHSCTGDMLWCKGQNKKKFALLITAQSLLLKDRALHSPQLLTGVFHKQKHFKKINLLFCIALYMHFLAYIFVLFLCII